MNQTSGNYTRESNAVVALHRHLETNHHNLFAKVYHEVWGEYRRVPPKVDPAKKPRIDFVVMPSAKLIQLGWVIGPIFIEVKRSDIKPAKTVSQCMDYRSAVFELIPGYCIEPQWIFIFPFDHPTGELASIMAQNCIGSATLGPLLGLKLMAGPPNVLIENQEQVTTPNCGKKIGSR